jgi:hypothetical protein
VRQDHGHLTDRSPAGQDAKGLAVASFNPKGICATMTRTTIAGGAIVIGLVLFAVIAAGFRALTHDDQTAAAASPAIGPSTTPTGAAAETHPAAGPQQGFLYGRVTTPDGTRYEGRLRWGKVEEAFWGDYFNGAKEGNRWVAQVPPEQLPKERHPIAIFGLEIAQHESPLDLGRQFMTRFGDIARIEGHGRDVQVTLKSGTVFHLDRFEASDFDDGVRVWDGTRGVVDLDSLRIRTIELLPAPALGADLPHRLHGTVRTRQGDFTGFVQWNREACVGTDELEGRTAEGKLSLRFDTIRSIERRPRDRPLVTLLDGREIALSGTLSDRGIYVDDRRYGRVLVSRDAFAGVDFSPGGSGPAYSDFPPGRPLTGRVTTRTRGDFTGRLVYDLDESETTETLDAPSQGVDYTIPFGLVTSIALPGREEHGSQVAQVTLDGGEELQLERAGDLGERNAGLLIFVGGRERPEYVPWSEVQRIDFENR